MTNKPSKKDNVRVDKMVVIARVGMSIAEAITTVPITAKNVSSKMPTIVAQMKNVAMENIVTVQKATKPAKIIIGMMLKAIQIDAKVYQ